MDTTDSTGAPRARVLHAARDLFLERGYLATTVGAIAERARVALQTIYSGYGSKVGILAVLQDQAVAGDADAVAVVERDWVRDLRSLPRTEALRTVVSHFAESTERAAPILAVIHDAASDASVHELLERLHDQRLITCRHVAQQLLREDDGDHDHLADELYVLLGVEMYQLLVRRRGWTRQRWEHWVEGCLVARRRQLRPER